MTQETSEVDLAHVAEMKGDLEALYRTYHNNKLDPVTSVEAGAPARGLTLKLLQMAVDNPTTIPAVLEALQIDSVNEKAQRALKKYQKTQDIGHLLALLNSPYAQFWGTENLRRH